MKDYFSAIRRFNYPVPMVEADRLQTKGQHLNDAIKMLIFWTLSPAPDAGSYYVLGTTLYTPSVDSVSGTTWNVNNGTVSGTKLILQ
ncbi:MAG: hypothetical protein IJG38_02320 [Thermoguttaceae bacterium]|nr:hypothetical protein [Thermoguttaceae bacterium]